jgi:hypothetical protein
MIVGGVGGVLALAAGVVALAGDSRVEAGWAVLLASFFAVIGLGGAYLTGTRPGAGAVFMLGAVIGGALAISNEADTMAHAMWTSSGAAQWTVFWSSPALLLYGAAGVLLIIGTIVAALGADLPAAQQRTGAQLRA